MDFSVWNKVNDDDDDGDDALTSVPKLIQPVILLGIVHLSKMSASFRGE